MYEIININGATFIFSPFSRMESASLGVFLRIGSRFEQKPVKGIAHFLEHMVFKGSNKYSHRQIKQEVEGRGGDLNAFTSQEITAYYANFLNKNLKYTLDILLDMAYNPLLKIADINKEREVILEEIKMYNDLPAPRAVMLLDRLLWENHPLGEEIIGYESTVNKINRNDLNDFKNKYYVPSNTVIAFSGAVDKKQVVDLLRLKITPKNKNVNLKTIVPSDSKKIRIKCEKKSLQQSHLCVGFRSVSYLSKDKLTAQLINIILGANMSSRLFESLREKKSLCYDISTELRKYKDSGAFVIHAGLDKTKILVALRAIIKELSKIKEKEVSQKELSRAKDYLLGQVIMSLERPGGRMFYAAQSYINLGRIDLLSDIKRKIEIINPKHLKTTAQSIFKFSNICISCVGDIDEKIEEKIKKIVNHEH